jgi:hypothetical protein
LLVTLLSFAVFWSDTASSDALSYGVTIIVVNLLLNVVLVGALPGTHAVCTFTCEDSSRGRTCTDSS